jgi:hypothetical protein
MAANDYYSNTFTPHHSHNQAPFQDDYHQPTLNTAAPPGPYGDPISPSSYDGHSAPYHGRFSQNSFTSENAYYSSGGKNPGADQYAEDIPLKPNAQTPQMNDAQWMHPDTQYGRQMPMDPDLSGRPTRKTRKPKFFNKKIAWVTYLLTIVDVGVFVGELIRSGMF